MLLVFINQYKDDVNAGLAPAPVLIADRLIPRGTSAGEVITNKLFKPAAVAEENIRPGAVTQASQIAGMVAVREVLPGQQITVADFAAAADPIRSRLTKTERAVQIPIDKVHGMLTTIRAGDRVDILAAFNAAAPTNGSGTPTLEPLMRDIRIMQNTGDSVILETTDQQGARLAFAADNAKLWFLLRPPDRGDGQQADDRQPGLAQAVRALGDVEGDRGRRHRDHHRRGDGVMSVAPIRTLVAVDGAIDRRALEGVLGDPGIEVVEVLETHGELADATADLQIDAMLVACNGHPDVALAYVAEAARERPNWPIVVVTTSQADALVREVFTAGADDILTLTDPAQAGAGDVLRAPEGDDPAVRARRSTPRATGELICVLGPKGGTGKTLTVGEPRDCARAGRPLDGRRRPRPPVRRLRAGARLRARSHDLRPRHVGRHAGRREARRLPRDAPVGAAGPDGADAARSGDRRDRRTSCASSIRCCARRSTSSSSTRRRASRPR